MSGDDYFAVQRIYLGRWTVGLLLPAAFIADVALAVAVRHDAAAFWLAAAAAALIAVNLAIFILWTQPVNTVTENWAERLHWQALRQQWEYSHAVNAGRDISGILRGDDRAAHRHGAKKGGTAWLWRGAADCSDLAL